MSTFFKQRRLNSSLLLAVASLCVTSTAPAMAELYFSEFIEGSSYNKALEIYNPDDASVDLSAYQIQMYFNGNTSATTNITLAGTLAAHSVFVIAHSSANSDILALANQTNGANWFNGDDAVVLKKGSDIIDSIGQIGTDPGSQWGTGLVSTADNTLRRKLSVSGGDTNASDAFDPSLEWDGFATDAIDDLGVYAGASNQSSSGNSSSASSSSTGNSGANNCGTNITPIAHIQGDGAASPLAGSNLSIEAIVIGDYQASGLIGGFFVQQADGTTDGNPATSEGIYIASAAPVALGDLVHVTGTVAETYGLTQIVASNLIVCASNQPLPTAVNVNLPLSNLSEFEAVEAMRVRFAQNLTVNETYQLGRYGQVLLANGRLMQPTNQVAPGSAAQALQAQNLLNQIMLDDGSNLQNPDPIPFPAPGLSAANSLRSGDTVANLIGVMHYDFGEYRLLPSATPQFVATNARTSAPDIAPELAAQTNLKIASFNVLNFFNGDGLGGGFPTERGANTATEFARQKAKTISALMGLNADVIGLLELENDGYDNYSAIAELTAALNSAMNTNVWHFVNPGLSKIGTDAIAVGIIYRSDKATAIGEPAILDSSVAPLFVDTKNRPSLAQSFRATQGGGQITIAINHFKSKGSDCLDLGDADTGDGQGNCNITRTNAAQALVNWLSQNPTGIMDSDYLIIGDLNAYAMEDPITQIRNSGYTDLIRLFNGAEAYSYVFDGQAGYLDHGLASHSLAQQVLAAADWHINADEPLSLDYNTEYKSAGQLTSLYAADAYRSSDHDPLVISLKLVIDLDGDGDVDKNDVKIVTAARNTIASEWDQRDLNQDGVINALDARALTLLCTRAGCATNE